MILIRAGDFTNLSGVTYTILILTSLIALYKSRTLFSSFCELLLDDRVHAGIPKFSTNDKLSSMSESRGMITKVTPWSVTADNWKVKLFPPPVGMSANTFFPDFVALIISSWFSRKEELPKIALFAS
jgi:hypothetical protein